KDESQTTCLSTACPTRHRACRARARYDRHYRRHGSRLGRCPVNTRGGTHGRGGGPGAGAGKYPQWYSALTTSTGTLAGVARLPGICAAACCHTATCATRGWGGPLPGEHPPGLRGWLCRLQHLAVPL